MNIFTVADTDVPDFTFDLRMKVDLTDHVIVAVGGASNLSETFVYLAASCGATLILVEKLPGDPEAKKSIEQRVSRMACSIETLGRKKRPEIIIGDITDAADMMEVTEYVVSKYGKIDTAVDFAGMHHPPFDLYKDDPAAIASQFRAVIELNLTGAFIFTAAVARVMIPRRSGHIIHLCSSGSRASLYGSYAYNASKHGLEGLVKTAAAQLAPFGVRVNGIAPGTVETNLNRALLRKSDGDYKPRAKSILAHTPSKRFCTREGVAETLIAMCVAQRHLTGNVIFADDGYVVEGHSWPEGNECVYQGPEALDRLFEELDREYPKADA